ncbi:GntR family transcriptional regulator [Pelagibacterium luteolum]|uniref:DNA-binding transcriptional regulator, GntR family n=1 Tax=Pelagibacterium luteolum TaxID=440168 RepID=A0A1G7XDF0_9HYPH|nr:GntR family transcriptional regulator [Pelagibacterium luteolum]SDG82206.1 DNA-binding transcriptional regulator, GntR family [Pelagibacterium luteolum]
MKTVGKRVSLRDTAYDEIRKLIVTCELRPGQPLTVTDLAEALNIGRTPVIQAIDRLAVDGLVDVMPRKGIVVSPVSLDDFMEVIEMRMVNETAAVRWAAERASRAEIAMMEANLAGIWQAAKDRNIDEFISLDRDFHRLITQSASNRILGDVLSSLHDKALRFWFISLKAPDHNIRVCEQHAAVIEGIKSGNLDVAEKAMREHIASFQMNATSQIMRA